MTLLSLPFEVDALDAARSFLLAGHVGIAQRSIPLCVTTCGPWQQFVNNPE
jgi:hypothetical protein